MNAIGILLHLFVTIINKNSFSKKILFELGSDYQLELIVNRINVTKKETSRVIENDCALIPLKDQPNHDLI
tara:strand:- start:3300 stop:3512 length:213 start_codon:yes stop_codon:yes gene_type:complete